MSDHQEITEADVGELPVAIVDSRRRSAAVWLVPIAAVAVVLGFFLREWAMRGPTVELELPRATGLEPGRTPVVAHGVPIGLVERVRLDPTLMHPIAEVRLERWASAFAREGSSYWVVRPSIGFRGVSGLETIASGPVIEARPGPDHAARLRRFVALPRPPFDTGQAPGLRILLAATQLGSIRVGAPLTYRGVEVGEVVDAQLASDARTVMIGVLVSDRFAPLVREGSRFWMRSGFGLDVGMTGLKLRTESLESMLGGGVAFATPSADAPPAANGAIFSLADEPDKEWLRWTPAIAVAEPDPAGESGE